MANRANTLSFIKNRVRAPTYAEIAPLRQVSPLKWRSNFEDFVTENELAGTANHMEAWLFYGLTLVATNKISGDDIIATLSVDDDDEDEYASLEFKPFSDGAFPTEIELDDLDDSNELYPGWCHMLLNGDTVADRMMNFMYCAKTPKAAQVKSFYLMLEMNMDPKVLDKFIIWMHHEIGGQAMDNAAKVLAATYEWFKYRVSYATGGSVFMDAHALIHPELAKALIGESYDECLYRCQMAKEHPESKGAHHAIPPVALAFAKCVMDLVKKDIGEFYAGTKALKATPANVIQQWKLILSGYFASTLDGVDRNNNEDTASYVQRMVQHLGR